MKRFFGRCIVAGAVAAALWGGGHADAQEKAGRRYHYWYHAEQSAQLAAVQDGVAVVNECGWNERDQAGDTWFHRVAILQADQREALQAAGAKTETALAGMCDSAVPPQDPGSKPAPTYTVYLPEVQS